MKVATFSKQANLLKDPQNYIQNITHVEIQEKTRQNVGRKYQNEYVCSDGNNRCICCK